MEKNIFVCQMCMQTIPEEFISCPNNACIKVATDKYNETEKDSYWHDLYT